eukprot:357794-Chlamydomonas_euryale.AAC.3
MSIAASGAAVKPGADVEGGQGETSPPPNVERSSSPYRDAVPSGDNRRGPCTIYEKPDTAANPLVGCAVASCASAVHANCTSPWAASGQWFCKQHGKQLVWILFPSWPFASRGKPNPAVFRTAGIDLGGMGTMLTWRDGHHAAFAPTCNCLPPATRMHDDH